MIQEDKATSFATCNPHSMPSASSKSYVSCELELSNQNRDMTLRDCIYGCLRVSKLMYPHYKKNSLFLPTLLITGKI